MCLRIVFIDIDTVLAEIQTLGILKCFFRIQVVIWFLTLVAGELLLLRGVLFLQRMLLLDDVTCLLRRILKQIAYRPAEVVVQGLVEWEIHGIIGLDDDLVPFVLGRQLCGDQHGEGIERPRLGEV